MAWHQVLPEGELGDGDLREVEAGGVTVLLIRDGETIAACPPLCPHQDEVLHDAGLCVDGVLTCTKHLWQWDIRTGEPQGEAERPLLLYPVRIEGGAVQVCVERELRYPEAADGE